MKSYTDANPNSSIKLGSLHYSIWKNRLTCDSIALETKNSEYTYNAVSVSISGIHWMKAFWQKNIALKIFTNSIIDADKITFKHRQSQNELQFGALHISAPDPEITAKSIRYHYLIDDEQFFAKSKYKQTRYRFDISQIKMTGLDCIGALQGTSYKVRSVKMNEPIADILLNDDKPHEKNTPNPKMPNEALFMMKEIVKIDSLIIINGQLKYSERFVKGIKPGAVTFNKVNVLVRGISNHTKRQGTIVVRGEGLFMNAGKMKLLMEMPLNPKEFSLRYSGSLGEMDGIKINSFIEQSEHKKIKSGTLQSASYSISVNSGHASGALKLIYKDLTIAVLNKETGSENGVFDKISSLIGKIFVIRGSNLPDKSGAIKIGVIEHTRKPDEPFVQFLWFSIRGGLGDVIGF